jgi:CRISPR/Cas system CSM-associated protein Csm3 (group 7 of RAMP superfamily)
MGKYYRISGVVNFPEGLAAGESRGANAIEIARNGEGLPVLRGTSIAGALRNGLREAGVPDKSICFWFGDKLEGKNDFKASQIVVADVVLNAGEQTPETRMHNQVDRKTGSVADTALFGVEMLPPQTKGQLLIYVIPRDEQPAENILRALEGVFATTLLLGGNRNRGIGRMDASDVKCYAFDCSTVDGFAKWQDVRYADRSGLDADLSGCAPVSFGAESTQFVKNYKVIFKIPRGEDISVGYGKNLDGDTCAPQYVYEANGTKKWRIPGSSFRGVIRSWMTRLAVKDGAGEEPILDLFGTLKKRGRIHFTDAYCLSNPKENCEQSRAHVAVDRFSGGTVQGALFFSKVLVGNCAFEMNVSVVAPNAKELEWLKKTLLAIHLGIISIGSSKASGLLEIENWDELKNKIESDIAELGVQKAEV